MKTLSKLTYRYLKLNKKKSLITIISILLVTILIFSLGLGASTVRKNSVDSIADSTGLHHVKFYDIAFNSLDILNNNTDIKEIGIMQNIGDFIESDYQINIITITDNLNSYFKNLRGSFPTNEQEIIISENLSQKGNYVIGDSIDNKKVVGIFSSSPLNRKSYDATEYYVYTASSFIDSYPTTFYVTFKKVADAYQKTFAIAESLGLEKDETMDVTAYYNTSINASLLAANGEYYYESTKIGIYAIFSLILIVVSLFCVLIVRNSFTISLSERKKEFGSLTSIGASKKQIFKMVMLEASMLSIIAIPLGIILSFLFVSLVLFIFNSILDTLIIPYQIYLYPEFIIISLIFILITVYASAFAPALKSSKVTPMEAVREIGVYKIKKSKEHYPIIKKIFGVEGEVAYKNMKRNRRKFTSSTLSLCISIILFVAVSAVINFMLTNYANHFEEDFDIVVTLDDNEEIVNEIASIPSIDEVVIYKNNYLFYEDSEFLTEEYKSLNQSDDYYMIRLYGIDNNTYENYLEMLEIDYNYLGILVNNAYKRDEDTNAFVQYDIFINNSNFNIDLTTYEQIYNQNTNDYDYIFNNPYLNISNIFIANEFPYFSLSDATLIVDFDTYDYIVNSFPDNYPEILKESDYTLGINSSNYVDFDREINNIIDNNPNISIEYINYDLYNYENKLAVTSIAFLLYIILAFISLISITTIFSSLNTSILTREKEFSVLRSIGMSKKGLNKMLVLESIFLGLRVLIISIPISIFVVWFIRTALKLINATEETLIIPYPTVYVIGAIIAVLLLIILITMYSLHKIKKKNIVDSIKNENI